MGCGTQIDRYKNETRHLRWEISAFRFRLFIRVGENIAEAVRWRWEFWKGGEAGKGWGNGKGGSREWWASPM